jgi:hypothetical protein
MKASELRIGNLIKGKSPEKKVYEEPVELNEYYFLLFLNNMMDVEPIPLTEEWLLKFGFEKTEWDNFNSYRLIIGNNDYAIVLYSDGNCEVGDIITCKIEYVHQLQNLYFALTGEELKQQEQ